MLSDAGAAVNAVDEVSVYSCLTEMVMCLCAFRLCLE